MNNINDDDKLTVPYSLFMLLVSLNKKVFNPHEMIKNNSFPPSHGRVLFYLIHHGSTPISEIGRDLFISKPNMTPIIDKLETEGLIKRYNDENDRRIIRVEATDIAFKFFKSQEATAVQNLSKKLEPLSDDDMDKLSNLINEMNHIFSKL